MEENQKEKPLSEASDVVQKEFLSATESKVVKAEDSSIVKDNEDKRLSDWRNKLDLVKSICAKGTSDQEFELFVYTAKRYSLDPLKKEIWAIKYGYSPANIMVGRDGYLSIAHKTIDPKNGVTVFDGMKTDFVRGKEESGRDSVATCHVFRKDMSHPIVVSVSMGEYNPLFTEPGKTASPLWVKKPETMLKKVAESQALRKAFNVSGVYDPSEFGGGEGQ